MSVDHLLGAAAMTKLQVLTQLFALMAMIAVGVAARRTSVISHDALPGLTRLLMSIALPCTILSSFHFALTRELAGDAALVFAISAVVHLSLIALSRLLYRGYARERRHIFVLATAFSNCGFVGFPLAQSLFGDIGVFYAAIFTLPFNILIFSYGLHHFGDGRQPVWRSMFNLPMLSTLAGLLLFLGSLSLPAPVAKTMTALGAMTTPMSLLIIGAMLAQTNLWSGLRDRGFYLLSFVRLIAAPLVLYVCLEALQVDRTVLIVTVALVAMPSASLVGVFAQRHDGDSDTAAKSIFITTMLSALTLPAILLLLL